MSSKLLVVVATGDKEKALTALMYEGNALRKKWLDDVKVIYFGPSEKLMIEDAEVASKVIEVASFGEVFACKAISDRNGTSDKVSSMGVKLEYVGSIISNFIKDGYTPMVW